MHQFKPIAQRITNAENSFINSVIEQFNFTKPQAEKILAVYLKYKLVKIDCITGQCSLTDGLFWDKYPMNNALQKEV